MKTYLFTSKKFTGHIEFSFSDDGLLQRFDTTQAVLNSQQSMFLINNMPKTYQAMRQLVTANPDMKLSLPLKTNITFEELWNKCYINKGSSKKISLKIFERMTQQNRDGAFNYWDTYIDNKPNGEGIKYVETYLRSEIWNN
jgi:hypothetical protein